MVDLFVTVFHARILSWKKNKLKSNFKLSPLFSLSFSIILSKFYFYFLLYINVEEGGQWPLTVLSWMGVLTLGASKGLGVEVVLLGMMVTAH